MILTIDQIKELTKKTYPSAQARELAFMGITYSKRLDGSLVVSTNCVEKALGLNVTEHQNSLKEPDWDALKDA